MILPLEVTKQKYLCRYLPICTIYATFGLRKLYSFQGLNCIIWFPTLFIEDKLILLLVILHYLTGRTLWTSYLFWINHPITYLVGCVIQKTTLIGPRKSSSTAVEGRAKDNGTDSIVSLMVLMNRYKEEKWVSSLKTLKQDLCLNIMRVKIRFNLDLIPRT